MAEDIISKLKLLNKNSGGWGGVVVLGVDAFWAVYRFTCWRNCINKFFIIKVSNCAVDTTRSHKKRQGNL